MAGCTVRSAYLPTNSHKVLKSNYWTGTPGTIADQIFFINPTAVLLSSSLRRTLVLSVLYSALAKFPFYFDDFATAAAITFH